MAELVLSKQPPPEEKSVFPAMLAAIDVGTNAVRLQVAEVQEDGRVKVLKQVRHAIRPGEGVYETGVMQPHVADRLVLTLTEYQRLCAEQRASIKAVATSALRKASNRAQVLHRIEEEAGVKLEIISGQEEARLIYLGVMHGVSDGKPTCDIDIGGGSTEVVIGEGPQPSEMWSIGLGCVQLTEKFKGIEKDKLSLMRRYAAQTLFKGLPSSLRVKPVRVMGSSGTIREMVRYSHKEWGLAADGDGVKVDLVTAALEKIVGMDDDERRDAFGERRADVILAGGVILESVMMHLGLSSITPVSSGLRDGLIVDQYRRLASPGEDPYLTSAVIEIGKRFHFDEDHARQVSRLSLKLFDELAGIHKLSHVERRLLEVAALLDDIGYIVNRSNHQEHTRYLLQHLDIPGLTQVQQEFLSDVVTCDVRTFSDSEVTSGEGRQRQVMWMSLLLRLADSLDRSHAQVVQSLSIENKKDTIRIRVEASDEALLEMWTVEKFVAVMALLSGKDITFKNETAS